MSERLQQEGRKTLALKMSDRFTVLPQNQIDSLVACLTDLLTMTTTSREDTVSAALSYDTFDLPESESAFVC